MNAKMESQVGLLMGIVIVIADLYWTYTSYTDALWLALGVIIFIAGVIWLYVDYDLMSKK